MSTITSTATPTLRRMTVGLAMGLAAACGSDKAAEAGSAGASGAAPTADEVNAAQASSQSAGDGSEAGSAASQSSTARAASLRDAEEAAAVGATATATASTSPLTLRRARCWSSALKAGQALRAASKADLQAHLFGGTSMSADATLTSSFGKGGATVDVGILTGGKDATGASTTANFGASASVPANLPLIFDPADCALGGHVLSGNELIVTSSSTGSASGSLYDLQVIANLSYQVGGGTVKIASADATKATYELQTSLDAAADARTFALVLNEHRVRTNASAKVDLDVDTTTPSAGDANALVVVETYAQVSASDAASTAAYASVATREVASGTITTVHNLAKFTAEHTFMALKHDLTGSCSCPSSGSMTQVATAANGSRTATHTYTFTGCGEATVASQVTAGGTTASGSTQVTWANCN